MEESGVGLAFSNKCTYWYSECMSTTALLLTSTASWGTVWIRSSVTYKQWIALKLWRHRLDRNQIWCALHEVYKSSSPTLEEEAYAHWKASYLFCPPVGMSFHWNPSLLIQSGSPQHGRVYSLTSACAGTSTPCRSKCALFLASTSSHMKSSITFNNASKDFDRKQIVVMLFAFY